MERSGEDQLLEAYALTGRMRLPSREATDAELTRRRTKRYLDVAADFEAALDRLPPDMADVASKVHRTPPASLDGMRF